MCPTDSSGSSLQSDLVDDDSNHVIKECIEKGRKREKRKKKRV